MEKRRQQTTRRKRKDHHQQELGLEPFFQPHNSVKTASRFTTWDKDTLNSYLQNTHLPKDLSYNPMSPSLSALEEPLHKKNKKTFSCDVCDKIFTRNSSLQTHMNIHLNRKPYQCSICKFRFNANPNLIRHKKNVHNMKFAGASTDSNSSEGCDLPAKKKDSSLSPNKLKTSLPPSQNLEPNSSYTLGHGKLQEYGDSSFDPLTPDQHAVSDISGYKLLTRKLPEPIWNFERAHPVKFLDLVRYETVINLVDARSKIDFAPNF